VSSLRSRDANPFAELMFLLTVRRSWKRRRRTLGWTLADEFSPSFEDVDAARGYMRWLRITGY
jgi:hypothetical protein